MADLRQTIRWVFETTGALTAMQNVSRRAQGLNKQFGGLARMAAGAFAVRNIVNYAQEAVQLAGTLQGVRSAFEALNEPYLLRKLNTATAGTVTNLELMQKSVLAVQLGIDKTQLPKYFEFATKRAQETGESVDYLVDSIVKGVGRKSALILDNLGISALRLAEELEKGGTYAEAVSRIINEEMAKSGGVIQTAAIAQAQLNKQLEDNKTLLGEQLVPAYNEFLKVLINISKPENNPFVNFGKNLKEANVNPLTAIVSPIGTFFNALKPTANLLGEVVHGQLPGMLKGVSDLDDQIAKNTKTTETWRESWAGLVAKSMPVVTTVGDLQETIAGLNKELAGAATNEQYRKITAQINKYTAALERLTNVDRAQTAMPGDLKGGDLSGVNLMPAQSGPQITEFITDSGTDLAIARMQKLSAAATYMSQNISSAMRTAAVSFAVGIGTMIGASLAGKATFADFGNFAITALAGMLEQLGQIAIETGVALLAIQTALKTMNPYVAIAAGVALVAIASAVRSKVGSLGGGSPTSGGGGGFAVGQYGAGVPHLAEGGIATSPTYALIGEGAESEAIMPLSKLQNLINTSGGGNMGGEFVLRGRNLFLAYNRENKHQTRIK